MFSRNIHQAILCLSTALLCVLPAWTWATHLTGGYTRFETSNGCKVKVWSIQYHDCAVPSTGLHDMPALLSVDTTCAPHPVALGPAILEPLVEITPVCPGTLTRCDTTAANIQGYAESRKYQEYSLCGAMNCTYKIDQNICCWYQQIVGMDMTMYNRNAVDFSAGPNSSPYPELLPRLYINANQPTSIYLGGTDPDGDSLTFTLGPCYRDQSTPMPYPAGYSAISPLGPSYVVNLDPHTGVLDVVPNPTGNLVVGYICVYMNEWRNNVLIAQSSRSYKITTLSAPVNTSPQSQLTQAVSGLSTLAPDVFAACAGQPFCFDISVTDPNPSDTLRLYRVFSWPGSTFTHPTQSGMVDTVYGSGGSATARFCWTAPSTGIYRVAIRASDNSCPLLGGDDRVVTIIAGVGGSLPNLISATGTLDLCAGIGDTLSTLPGLGNYFWNNVPGTHQFVAQAPGSYVLVVSNSPTCAMTDTVEVVAQTLPDISGNVYSHTGSPLVGQKMYLIRHDAGMASLHAVDSTLSDPLGYYQFCGIGLDTVYVKAAPDSALYPTDLPTYADTAFYWAAARAIYSANFPATVSFSCRAGLNPGGPGFIGGFLSQGANKRLAPGDPVADMAMFLLDATTREPLGLAYTDANGYFRFSNLPLGNYLVLADKPGVDAVQVPSVVLDIMHPSYDSLDFRLHSTYLELVWPALGQTPSINAFAASVYPNPMGVSGQLVLEMPAAGQLDMRVCDLRGRVLRAARMWVPAGKQSCALEAEDWGMEAGVYLLELERMGSRRVLRIVVE